MKKKIIFLTLTLFGSITIFAQLSIEECYEKAQANYPLVGQYGLIEQARDYNLQNAARAWLPQINISAKASYQSDVTKIPIDFSQIPVPQLAGIKMPEMHKDQYGATLEITQTLWDGGNVSARRKAIRANADAEKAELEVNLYALKERVNQLFFGILMCNALMEQNQLLQDELQRNFERVLSYTKNGLANQADIDAVKVEQLKAQQNYTQILHNKKAFLQMLSAFLGENLSENIVLQKPDIDIPFFEKMEYLKNKNARPEITLFESKLTSLNASQSQIKADLMPKFGLFLTGGYGNPALNMFEDGFQAYYIGGIRLSWNISNFYTYKNRQNLLNSNKKSIEIQKETFLFNTELNQKSKENEVEKYLEMLKTDSEIINLRNSVKRAYEAKVEGGTANISDLLTKIADETLAKQNKILHEIEMLQAVYNLKFIINN
jgi:outer membrane protein TolC